MSKIFSLLKASMTDNMNLFRVKGKGSGFFKGKMLTLFLGIIVLGAGYAYAELFTEQVAPVHLEYVVLSIYILLISILTLMEGIYKSGSLLYNCKDDNLLLALPISKKTVLFSRVFKFYVFELLYNSMYIVPAMACYAVHVNPGPTFYLVSVIGLLIFPIIPVIVSCIFGSTITFFSSKFRFKNAMQTIITMLFLLLILYISFNYESMMTGLAEHANTINEYITTMYYPAGAYIKLILEFNVVDLLTFIFSQLALLVFLVFLMSKLYFKTNSSVKTIKTKKVTKVSYKGVKKHSPRIALIKKEFKRFFSSPVFIINAGFGLVMFVAGCIVAIIKVGDIANSIVGIDNPMQMIRENASCILFVFMCFGTFMSSLTSCMISLEGKSYNILKVFPIKASKIFESKILTAMIIILPCIILGDLVVIFGLQLPIFDSILLLISAISLTLLSQTFGLLINIRYPKMNYSTDAEAVKQSLSTAIASLLGMTIVGLAGFGVYYLLNIGFKPTSVLALSLFISAILSDILIFILIKTSEKSFKKINV